jgi:hypothetical protein
MNNIINATQQLELGFNGKRISTTRHRNQTRMERAAWWFGRMRAVVDTAIAWQPEQNARPEQVLFPQTQRQFGA